MVLVCQYTSPACEGLLNNIQRKMYTTEVIKNARNILCICSGILGRVYTIINKVDVIILILYSCYQGE